MKNQFLSVVMAGIFGVVALQTTQADSTCYVVMDGSATTNYYDSFYDAFHSIGTGTGVITMIADDYISTLDASMRLDVTGNVTVVSDGGDWTITRGVTNAFTLLYVNRINWQSNGISNAVLNLGAPGMPGTLTFDGGSFWNDSSSLILNYRGTLNMYDGVTLKNNWSGYEGAGVYNEQTFNMYGGNIVSNKSKGWGAGIGNAGYWFKAWPSVVNMYGGTVAYNEAVEDALLEDPLTNGKGGGVANNGTSIFNLYGGDIIGNSAALAGGGVYVSDASSSGERFPEFNIYGGTIAGNFVTNGAGVGAGVYANAGLSMASNALVSADNEVYLDDTTITVSGPLLQGGIVATIDSASTTPGTKVAEVAPGAGTSMADALPHFSLITGATDALFESVRLDAIIRGAPTCYVVLNDSGVTNYYADFVVAFHTIGLQTGVITMVADDIWKYVPGYRLEATGNVTIVSDGGDWTITRADTNSPSMFYVNFDISNTRGLNNTATLNLGAPGMPGTLTLDGGGFWVPSASLILNYRGTFNMYDGVTLKNNWSGYEGAGIYNEQTVNIFGGNVVSNKTRGWGGGIDNAGYWYKAWPSVVNMYGGTIGYNEAIYDPSATFDIPNAIESGNGGGVVNDGTSTFNMYGGEIVGNSAGLKGGGIYVTASSSGGPPRTPEVNLFGGTISGNYVTNGLGNGIFADDGLSLASNVVISSDNEVYLSNTVITIASPLLATGVVAVVDTSDTTPGTKVAVVAPGSGATLSATLPHLVLIPAAPDALFEDSRIAAIVRSGPTCYVVLNDSGVTNYYADFVVAFHTIGTGTGVITMVANDVWAITDPTMTMDVTGHVTIVSDGGDWTITRTATNNRSMFYVNYLHWMGNGVTDAVLNLGQPGMPGTLTFDGGLIPGQIASIVVNYRGTFNMYDGVTLKNNISIYGGAGVYNEQVFNMYGGSIVSNITFGQGGGVQNNGYWSGGLVLPIFNMYGGIIAYNQSLNDENDAGGYGGGVDNHGYSTFNMYDGSIFGNIAGLQGGGVVNTRDSNSGNATGTFNMAGGVIGGNSLTNGSDFGAGVYSDDVMTMSGSAQITGDNNVFLADDALITVAGNLTAPIPVAVITAEDPARVVGVVDVDPGSGLTLEDAMAFFGSEPGYELVVDPFNNVIARATPFEAWLLRRGHDWEDPDFFADEDIDGDGLTTWQEFVADTEPADGADYFRGDWVGIKYGTNCWDEVYSITNIDLTVDVVTQEVCEVLGYTLEWQTSSGRVYDVETAPDLSDVQTWTVLTNFTATAKTNKSFFLPLDAWRDYFRVRVTRP